MYWTYRFELVAQPKFRDNNGKMIDRNARAETVEQKSALCKVVRSLRENCTLRET